MVLTVLTLFISSTGVKHRLQINDIADMDRADFAKRLGNVVKLEGNSV